MMFVYKLQQIQSSSLVCKTSNASIWQQSKIVQTDLSLQVNLNTVIRSLIWEWLFPLFAQIYLFVKYLFNESFANLKSLFIKY